MVQSFSPLTSPLALRSTMSKLSSSSSASSSAAAAAAPSSFRAAAASTSSSHAASIPILPQPLQAPAPSPALAAPAPSLLPSSVPTSLNAGSTISSVRPARASATKLTPEEVALILQQVEERKQQPIRGLPKAAVCPQAYAQLCDGFELEPYLEHFHVTSIGAMAHVDTDVSKELLGMHLPIPFHCFHKL